jgi:S-(hydroxymethyl)glutathione dehydrogenase/alcohol dehydrogenase
MKAAVLFHSPGTFSIEEVAHDKPRGREVVVRLAAAGLCHSDLHRLQRAYPLPNPIIMGHEGAGVVEAVGEDVTYLAPGDHVIGFSLAFCGHCEWCLSGRPNLCTRDGIARAPADEPRLRLTDGSVVDQWVGLGTFAERMLSHENSLMKIDRDFPLDRAAVLGCAVATGVGSALRTAKVRPGANVAVIGCGGVGLNCIQGARIAGANHIIGIDINRGKLNLALQFGATDIIDNSNNDALNQISDLLPGLGGVDYAFEALGLKETLELSFALLRPRGTAIFIGQAGASIELPIAPFLQERKIQGCIMGSLRFRQDLPYFIDLYRSGRLMLDEMVSRRIPLEDINAGYDAIGDGSIARSVIVFD